MSERNSQVKDYICTHFCEEPLFLSNVLGASEEKGLKPIHVPEQVGKTLYLLAKLVNPKRILEIGTLGGYSALWLAKALEENGKLITLESEPNHVAIAKENIGKAGFSDKIEVRLGEASLLLEEMIEKKEPSFDLIFLDADKSSYPLYLDLILALSREGTLLLIDNLIPKRGPLGEPDPRDNEAVAVYTFNQMLAHHPQLETILLPTIALEGGRLDALGLAIVHLGGKRCP